MRLISKYWMLQGIGWILFVVFNMYIAILTNEITVRVLWVDILTGVLGLLMSHAFRYVILRYRWQTKSTETLLLYVSMSLALLSAVFNLIYYLVLSFFQSDTFSKLSFQELLGSFVAVYFLFSIWSIIYFSWTYVDTNRKLYIERLKMESEMKDLELRTLRSNLQPHFIFNSLNSIRALIDENPTLARNAITHISNILRKGITQQAATDTLENELLLAEDYLSLEKIRFEERLQYTKKIDPAALSMQIPTMMLQTLVENAIKHGISKSELGGYLHMQSELIDNSLHIIVRNSGKLQAVSDAEDSLGFGVHATKQRLKILYGEHASFTIQQKEKEVIVHIIISKIKPA